MGWNLDKSTFFFIICTGFPTSCEVKYYIVVKKLIIIISNNHLYIRISPGFSYTGGKYNNSNMFCKIKLHIIEMFFKIRNRMSKNWKRLHPTPHPLTLRTYPTPCSHQNDCKWCKRDYLIFPRSLSLVSERPEENRKGVQPPHD